MDALDQSPGSSQIVQDLLERDTSPAKITNAQGLKLKTQTNLSNDTSSGSFNSSRTHSVPQYHFHGLASTQTQSQHHDNGEEQKEGSQKENIGAAIINKEPSPSRPLSPIPSSSRHLPGKPLHGTPSGGAVVSPNKGSSKRATNTTFQPPRTRSGTSGNINTIASETRKSSYIPPPQTRSRYKQPSRPPVRDSSQDSFACDHLDPEAHLLATAEQFVRPIAELTKDSPRCDTDSGSTSVTSMYHHRRGIAPQGRILVEATPSNSDSSQTQSQHERAYEESQYPTGAQNQDAFESMDVDQDGTNDFNKHEELPHPIIHPDLIASQATNHDDVVATQLIGIAETQPTTQQSTEVDNILTYEGATPSGVVESVLRSTANRTSSGPRSLLSMVPPQLLHRYRHFGNQNNSVPSAQENTNPIGHVASTPMADSSDIQETQPSFPEAPPPRRGFAVKTFDSRASSSRQPAGQANFLEVIPDSEPSRLDARKTSDTVLTVTPAAAPPREGNCPSTKGKARAINEDVEMAAPEGYVSEDEEDLPLAAVVAAAAPRKKPRGRPPSKKNAAAGKGKAKEQGAAPVQPQPTAVAKIHRANPQAKIQKPNAEIVNKRLWETGVVPSSLPEQDMPRTTRNTRRNQPTIIAEPPKKGKPAQIVPQSRQNSRAASTPSVRSVRQQQEEESDLTDLDEFGGEDRKTDIVDEEYEYQDVDMDTIESSRKRKRAPPVAQGQNGGKRTKRGGPTSVGARAKSSSCTTTQGVTSRGTRVFALERKDGFYYSGTVHSAANNGQYLIKFDDKTESWMDLEFLRNLELRVGDEVLYGDYNTPSEVFKLDDFNTSKDGVVVVLTEDEPVTKKVGELRVANKTISFCWKDRMLSEDDITTTVKPVKRQISASPSKTSLVSLPAPRGQRKKIMHKLGLIVTLGSLLQKTKENLMANMRNGGATLVDDLALILQMDGKHELQNNRWTLRKDDVKWIGHADITRLLLVADDCSQRPKFLMALALGIPCVSFHWVEDSIAAGKEEDWTKYMLPQGFSRHLQGRLTQQVDADWGSSLHQLTDIINNRLPQKLFADMSILCVGHDIICQMKGKRKAGNDSHRNEPANSVPRILLGMGADVVETVTEPRHASQDLSRYNYVVLKEPYQGKFAYQGPNFVTWDWVKESLVASRLIPLQNKSAEYQESQEA